jgi:hypothetical protein
MPKFANARIKTDVRFHINTRMCVFNTQVDVRFYIYIYINIYIYIYNREHANKFREAGQGVPDYIYIYIGQRLS